MGFNKVYKVLVEIFPEVDSRALKAVAIEHQKDVDAAVEVVLTEVIPFLTERSTCSRSSTGTGGILRSPEEAKVFANGSSSKNNALVEHEGCLDEEQNGPFYDAIDEQDHTFDDTSGMNLDSKELTTVRKFNERRTTNDAENEANADDVRISGDHSSEGTLSGMSQESTIRVGYDQISQLDLRPLEQENLGTHQSLDNSLHADSNNSNNCEKNIPVGNSVGLLSQSDFEPLTLNSPGSMVQLVDMLDIQNTGFEKELDCRKDAAINTESFSEMIDNDKDEPMLNTLVTRSGQLFSTDILEDIIADARSNKKTLLSAVETIISLMKEVELQEEAAEQAKQDAANGGLEILKRVEDLKQMLEHAKEANDMHAGEVYGEKAILATEARELQSRLLCLSDERDKSLGILDEMRQSLEMRLAAAEKERKMAGQEKLEKDDIAWKALKNQEVVMEKVVHEANILKQEAEENAKLREFLIDRGRVVDTLQGEISVICTDVRLLKEKFDERLPLSKSLTSSQTSCIVASSSSSSKSTTSEQVDQVTDRDDPSDTPEKTDLIPSSYEQEFVREETAADDTKELSDDGWEIFDNREAYM
ncbi:hypothetical protein ACH5RR_020139 [Cinchona calisaya]|uniref:CUE domain-containing protein n=1 Tax=Cinchona calisaya TaxID=153742 RepID=A0ABD2ZDM6_9GENT